MTSLSQEEMAYRDGFSIGVSLGMLCPLDKQNEYEELIEEWRCNKIISDIPPKLDQSYDRETGDVLEEKETYFRRGVHQGVWKGMDCPEQERVNYLFEVMKWRKDETGDRNPP